MRLRQLVFVSRERDRLARQICTLLDLKETYHDAGLINFGLENVLIPLGDTFFEIVMPVQENTTAERFLEKRNGDGGYMVIVDVDDFESEQKRVESSGIEIVWHGNRNEDEINARTIHLHPKQVGGAILSIDHMNPKNAWLWAGTNWEKDINKALVSHLCGVNICSANPDNLLSNWEKALGKKRSIGYNSIDLAGSSINFDMNTQSQSEYVSAFQIYTLKKSNIEKRALSKGFVTNNNIHLGGVDFLLVE